MRKKCTNILTLFMLFASAIIFAQIQVSGIVKDDSGEPLPGTYVESESGESVETDIDGTYTITANQGEELTFSFIGMDDMIQIVSGNSLNVTMGMDGGNVIDAVTITVPYGSSISEEDFVGSADVVTSDKISQMSSSTIQSALEANAPGVQVNQVSGQPGAGVSVRVRGVASLNGNNEPLYVVDGIPIQSGDISEFDSSSSNLMSYLNPNDIETMTVLEDATAASLYGSRGANGVVMITTKKGKSGRTKFNITSEYGFTDFAVDNYKKVGGDDFRMLQKESLYNNYILKGETPDMATSLANSDLETYYAIPEGGYVDWEDALFRKGVKKRFELSAKGGDEKTNFYISTGMYDEEGVAYGSDFRRLHLRANINHKASEKLKIGVNTYGAYTDQNRVSDASLYYANPFFRVNFDLTPTTAMYDSNGELLSRVGLLGQTNLVRERGLTDMNTETFRFQFSPFLDYEIMEGLTFRTKNSVDFTYFKENRYWSPSSNNGAGTNGEQVKVNNDFYTLTSSNTLDYVKSLGEHNFDFLIGTEYVKNKFNYVNQQNQNFPNDLLQVGSTTSTAVDNRDDFKDDVLISYLSKFGYNFKRKYYITATFRRDGSSRYPESNRWADFWSVGGAWNLAKEDFMDFDALDNLKIKAAYGTTGNTPKNVFGGRTLYSFDEQYNGSQAAKLDQIGDENLTWEKVSNFNVGVDFGFFKWLKGSFEYYRMYTTDMLQFVPYPATTGAPYDPAYGEIGVLENVGEMSNTGWEASITTKNFNKSNFKWSTTLTAFANKNKIEKLYGGSDIEDFPRILREGESIFSFYLRDAVGVNPETGQWEWYKTAINDQGQNYTTGETTTNSNEARKVVVGSYEPDVRGAFINDFKYKNFDLSVVFNYSIGGETYDQLSSYLQSDGANVYTPLLEGQLDRWTSVGDHTANPQLIWQNRTNSNYNSDRRLHDASYVRLKSLNFGYNLPVDKFFGKSTVSNARVYFQGNNILTWAKDDLYDPEVSDVYGINTPVNPVTKSFIFGLQVGF